MFLKASKMGKLLYRWKQLSSVSNSGKMGWVELRKTGSFCESTWTVCVIFKMGWISFEAPNSPIKSWVKSRLKLIQLDSVQLNSNRSLMNSLEFEAAPLFPPTMCCYSAVICEFTVLHFCSARCLQFKFDGFFFVVFILIVIFPIHQTWQRKEKEKKISRLILKLGKASSP